MVPYILILYFQVGAGSNRGCHEGGVRKGRGVVHKSGDLGMGQNNHCGCAKELSIPELCNLLSFPSHSFLFYIPFFDQDILGVCI